MRERIVLAPGLQNAELLSSLALHGVNSIGLRICSAGELARLALMRAGIAIKTELVGQTEEPVLVAEAIKGVAYFEKASYADIRELTTCIRTMRSLVTEENEQILAQTLVKGIFEEKNAAILQVYKRYMECLSLRNAADTVSLLRKAIRECGSISAELLTLKEYPLTPLENTLVEHLSGGKAIETDMETLFGVTEKPIRIESFRSCYGAPKEVEAILAEIYAENRLDQCTVAVSDAESYGQLFFDYALLYNIPISFGCGVSAVNSNPARLLALYERWSNAGFFGTDALNEMLSSDVFCRENLYELFPEPEDFPWATFKDALGSLRLTNRQSVNEKRLTDFRGVIDEKKAPMEWRCLPALEIVGRELALPVEEFIRKYTRLRRARGSYAERLLAALDASALGTLCEELKRIRDSNMAFSPEDLIPQVVKMRVCRQSAEEGKLHVTDIDSASAGLRDKIYLAGLSASKFPGSPKENYLLLDEDLKLFGPPAEALLSEDVIRQKNARFMGLVKLACALGLRVSVSFSEINIAELKADNPSSLIYELCRAEKGEAVSIQEMEARIKKTGYFEPAISATRLIGEAYIKGKHICPEPLPIREAQAVDAPLDKEYSASALELFFTCPRRFYLKYIMGIPEPEETDPFEVISAANVGKLAHSLLEQLGALELSRDEFRALSDDSFERFLKMHPALVPEAIPAEKEHFLDMMDIAYMMEPHREIVLKEAEIHCIHESGVRLYGFPDRVERLEDGSCRVVDFKSKNRIMHVENDIDTCLQVMIYSYLMEQRGLKVNGAEYRYIRLGETVNCRYDEANKQKLGEKLTQFRHSLENGDFPTAVQLEDVSDGTDPCRYCRYAEICGKQNGEGDEG